MSAYVVAAEHINAIVSYAITNQVSVYNPATKGETRITKATAQEIGRTLMAENVRSVDHRYNGMRGGEFPELANYCFEEFATPLTPVEAIKACHGLDYQSCETDDWETTFAWQILQAIISAAARRLAGYDEAPWTIDDTTRKNLRYANVVTLSSLTG